ncbi:MAG TPA: 23S rRNA (pseudouridine(1915)-N(3))-methyltransferase RlmH, partial [Acholeplasmataceae bacterium]|nr:23S rRNA (pseudouridine(1915)-N(3))-methyltransferase RlmH [Acholeplasmataceae bacterium]
MMEINLVCVGNIKEKYLKMAIDEYKKRIQAFAKLNIMEIKERNSDDSIKNLKEEGIDILNVVNDAYMITLEINGESVDSISFSEQIKKYFLYNNKKLYFVIG